MAELICAFIHYEHFKIRTSADEEYGTKRAMFSISGPLFSSKAETVRLKMYHIKGTPIVSRGMIVGTTPITV